MAQIGETESSEPHEADLNDSTDLHADCGCRGDGHAEYLGRSRNLEFEVPKTVKILEQPQIDGLKFPPCRVYLIGTAHFSKESNAEVEHVIRNVQPDAVMVELCQSRVPILALDEETVLKEAKDLSAQKIIQAIKQNGAMQGILNILLLSVSAHITKELGMAPGGEFRAAFREAKKVPGCQLHLGDRPINITLRRALASLGTWQKLVLAWCLITSKFSKITKEDVEKCKEHDLLEDMLREMAGEYPGLSEKFVSERDQYMAFSLRYVLTQIAKDREEELEEDPEKPLVIVAVVGMGHLAGIEKNWTEEINVGPLLEIPEESRLVPVIRYTIRGALLGLTGYTLYKTGSFCYNFLKSYW